MQSLRTLTSLQELDLSNNQLKSISDTSFHFLQNLKTVELNDNAIERISKGTFQVSYSNDRLAKLTQSYNQMVSYDFFRMLFPFVGRNSHKTRNIGTSFQ